MTVPLADCPTDELLAKYLDDALSPTVSGPLTVHVDSCSICQAKLDAITAGVGVSDRLRALSSVVLRGAADATVDRGLVATTATDTQVFGRDGIPMVPRVQVVRPQVPGYEVDVEIGRGGMGVVFKARHKRLNRTMALKMVLAAGVADPRVTQRFLFEAEVLARVQHPQVVQVYEVNMFTAPTGVVFPYLAMELLPGGTLLQWVNGRTLTPTEAAELTEGLARAVHAVHQQGIVHRDLKPANILRSADGVFKVSDFGLAKLTAESGANLTGTGMVVGTPAYMAPEQAGGEGPIGPPADVYSLGAMLFELLAGVPPFPGDDGMSVLLKVIRDPAPDVRSIRPDVPRDLAAVVMKCLEKEPARRYQSADDLADDLRRFLNRRPTRARTLSTVERVWYWARRNPHVASLLTGLAVAISAGFVSTFILWQRAEWTAGEKQKESFRAGLLDAQAKANAKEAEENQREADARAASLEFDRAVNRCEAGYVTDGLRRFVVALELAEGLKDEPLQRVIRRNIAAWEGEVYTPVRTFATKGRIRAANLSPDGRWVVTGDADYRVRVWDADSGELKYTFDSSNLFEDAARMGGFAKLYFTGVAVDPSGQYVAACTGHSHLLIWKVSSSKTLRIPIKSSHGSTTSLWRVGFAGGLAWVAGDENLLFGFDPATGRHVEALDLPDAVHPQGVAAAAGAWVMASIARPVGSLVDHVPRMPKSRVTRQKVTPSVTALHPTPDGTGLISGERNGRVIEWDLKSRRPVVTRYFPSSAWVKGVAVSADGNYVAASSTDGTARVWRRGDTTPVFGIELDGAYGGGVALTSDGRLYAANEDGQVVGYDIRSRLPVGVHLRRMADGILAVRPNGEVLVGEGDAVRLLRPPPSRHVPMPATLPTSFSRPLVRFLDFRPDGQAILVGCGEVNVYDPASGRLLAGPRAVEEEPLGGLFSADGTRIVYGARNSWGVLEGEGYQERYVTPLKSGYVGVFPHRPGRTLTYVSKEYALKHDTATGLPVGANWLESLVDINSRRLTASADGVEWRIATRDTVEFIRSADGKPSRPALKIGDTVTALTQTADGNTLMVLVADETAQLWDATTLQPRPTKPVPVRHRGAVSGFALSPDGTVLATGGRDRTVQFWDVETGLVLGPRRYHSDPVTTVVYSPTGREIGVGTSDGVAAVWQVPPPPKTIPLAELQDRYPTGGRKPVLLAN